MSIMTNYLEEKLINHLFRAVAYSHSSPASWFIGLHTAAYGESGTGGTEVSTSGTTYVRIAVTRGSGFTLGSSSDVRTVYNASTITFGVPSANWGQVTHVGIWDHLSNTTNLIIEAQLQFAKTINNGDPAPKFNAGELKFTFD
jgi:hypothetical protein